MPEKKKLSVLIPAHNEEDCIEKTVLDLTRALQQAKINYELVLVNDVSQDRTPEIINRLARQDRCIRLLHRQQENGFGHAVRDGLSHFTGDFVVICMADASDRPQDVIRYFRAFEQGFDCAFGSRFVRGSVVKDYPPLKLFINRLANLFIQVLFMTRYNDMTNAFKGFSRKVIQSIKPIVAEYFNITVELPLKAITRGFKYQILPIQWYGRTAGVSKLKIREMSRQYLFTVLYCWLEKHLLNKRLPPSLPGKSKKDS